MVWDYPSITVTIPLTHGCNVSKYSYTPGESNVIEKESPADKTGLSKSPLEPVSGVPAERIWVESSWFIQVNASPVLIRALNGATQLNARYGVSRPTQLDSHSEQFW